MLCEEVGDLGEGHEEDHFSLEARCKLDLVGPPVPLFAEPGFSSVEDGEHSVPTRCRTKGAILVKVEWSLKDE